MRQELLEEFGDEERAKVWSDAAETVRVYYEELVRRWKEEIDWARLTVQLDPTLICLSQPSVHYLLETTTWPEKQVTGSSYIGYTPRWWRRNPLRMRCYVAVRDDFKKLRHLKILELTLRLLLVLAAADWRIKNWQSEEYGFESLMDWMRAARCALPCISRTLSNHNISVQQQASVMTVSRRTLAEFENLLSSQTWRNILPEKPEIRKCRKDQWPGVFPASVLWDYLPMDL